MDRERNLILSGRPPTLCWEGVALGWKEEFPRPRSRGGDIPPPPLSAGWKNDPSTPDFSEIPTTPSLSSVKSDSALNSMEYWDYSVELECLSGPEGIHYTMIQITFAFDYNENLLRFFLFYPPFQCRFLFQQIKLTVHEHILRNTFFVRK